MSCIPIVRPSCRLPPYVTTVKASDTRQSGAVCQPSSENRLAIEGNRIEDRRCEVFVAVEAEMIGSQRIDRYL
jgi:hypothetical protein